MGRLILILGGARSGKSTHALRLARANAGQVVFIATAEAQDDEMRARVAAHQAERPAGHEIGQHEKSDQGIKKATQRLGVVPG